MARVRTDQDLVDNRIHDAAAKKDGYAEVKRLVEEENINVNVLHSEYHTYPIEFSAQTGSLCTIKYLLEHKADIRAKNGDANLLKWSLEKKNSEKIQFLSTLYADFEDGTTKLSAAILIQDRPKITAILSQDPESLFEAKDHDHSEFFKYLKTLTQENFQLAPFLLRTYLEYGTNKSRLLDNVEALLFTTVRPNDLESCKRSERIALELIPLLKWGNTLRMQLIKFALDLIIVSSRPDFPTEKISQIVNKTWDTLTDTHEFDKPTANLGWVFTNLVGKRLEDIKGPSKRLHEISLKIMPISKDHVETIFLSAVKAALAANADIRSLAIRISTLLDNKNLKLVEDETGNSIEWLNSVILPLMQMNTLEMYRASLVFLKLALRIAPKSTHEDQEHIAKLHFLMVQNYCLLQDFTNATNMFYEFKLDSNHILNDPILDEILVASGQIAKNKNYDAIQYVRDYVSAEKFLERLKVLICNDNRWEVIYYILEALYATKHSDVVLPNTMIQQNTTPITHQPLIVELALKGQDKIIKYFYNNASILPNKGAELNATGTEEIYTNCTALYFAGITGNLILFNYLLNKECPLYNPSIQQNITIPFIHQLLKNAAANHSLLSNYYQILELVMQYYPDEINHIWKDQTVIQFFDSSLAISVGYLKPALRSTNQIKQEILEAQIRKWVIENKTLELILSGSVKLTRRLMGSDQLDIVNIQSQLHMKIQVLSSFINPFIDNDKLRVTELFYITEFLAWKSKYETQARYYQNALLPIVEIPITKSMLSDINIVIKLVQDYFRMARNGLSLQVHAEQDERMHLSVFPDDKPEDNITSLDDNSPNYRSLGFPSQFFAAHSISSQASKDRPEMQFKL